MKAMMQVFGYLDVHFKGRIIIDPTKHDRSQYKPMNQESWSEMYPGAAEDLPDGMPTPKGKKAEITVFVVADHARDKVT